MSKRLPLTLGPGGRVIGSGEIDEDGYFVGEIDDSSVKEQMFPRESILSISIDEELNNGQSDP